MAVRSLNLAIERGECFGLLGPNGAGKSTSISMMIGLLEPSAGTAVIGGHDITKDMDAIYTMMGVCPQHDLLWENLTGVCVWRGGDYGCSHTYCLGKDGA